jgi:hypothetical protein
MKVATVFSLLLVSASAFNSPMFATRAVGKAPATKAVAKKVVAKKAPPAKKVAPMKKVVAKKVVAKKVVAKKVVAKKVVVKKVVVKKTKKPAFQLKGATAVRTWVDVGRKCCFY